MPYPPVSGAGSARNPQFGSLRFMFIQQRIASAAIDRCRRKGVVASGPFQGMPATVDALEHHWGRLLGVYEIWLQDAIRQVLRSEPAVVVDVGASTGCYSLGFAHALPGSKHIAFEMDDKQRSRFKASATKISTPVDLRGFCGVQELRQIASEFRRGFLLMDCEGYERELLNDAVHVHLKSWTILVEVHDWHAPGVGEEIHARFSCSHDIQEIWNRPYEARDFRFLLPAPLHGLCFSTLSKMCDDGRNSKMRWFLMAPAT